MRSILVVALLSACGGTSTPPANTEPTPPATGGACVKGGCSGTMCAEPGKDMISTCEYKAEYGCYSAATCERQGDGSCGWTQSAELTACLANPPPVQ